MTITQFCTRCGTEAHPRIVQKFSEGFLETLIACSNCAAAIAQITIPAEQFPNFDKWVSLSKEPIDESAPAAPTSDGHTGTTVPPKFTKSN